MAGVTLKLRPGVPTLLRLHVVHADLWTHRPPRLHQLKLVALIAGLSDRRVCYLPVKLAADLEAGGAARATDATGRVFWRLPPAVVWWTLTQDADGAVHLAPEAPLPRTELACPSSCD